MERILQRSVIDIFVPGDVLCREKTYHDELFVIIYGTVAITKNAAAASAVGAVFKFVLDGDGGGTWIVSLKDTPSIVAGDGEVEGDACRGGRGPLRVKVGEGARDDVRRDRAGRGVPTQAAGTAHAEVVHGFGGQVGGVQR